MKARILPAALAALGALLGPAAAQGAGLRHAPARPAVVLPGDASAAAARADRSTWIVAARSGGGALARAHRGRRIAARAWLVPRDQARDLAGALGARGLLDYAEPNRIGRRAQAPAPDPLSALSGSWWRSVVVGSQVPPAVGPASPLIGLVDTQLDAAHAEIAGSNIASAGVVPLRDFHATATATIAAAPANGVGILGVWPGARLLDQPLPNGEQITCADSAHGIAAAIGAGAAVINMSYGSAVACITEEQQILRAVKAGAVPVAASGNEGGIGNPLEFPASLAHVITVSAIGPDGRPTGFSNANGAVDLSAPGLGILAGVPVRFDPDGIGDGFAVLAGTSFAAPMVSAAVAWVRAARPDLTAFQAAQVVRLGAADTGPRGYDDASGFGVLSLAGALSLPAPADDPLEPNDDVRYVNGRAFGTPAAPIFTGKRASIAAMTDLAEDPVDVYRLRIPARKRVRIGLFPRVGDPDLAVYGARTRGLRRGASLRRSTKRDHATDRVTVRNRRRHARTFYVAVGFARGKRLQLFNSSYVLRVR